MPLTGLPDSSQQQCPRSIHRSKTQNRFTQPIPLKKSLSCSHSSTSTKDSLSSKPRRKPKDTETKPNAHLKLRNACSTITCSSETRKLTRRNIILTQAKLDQNKRERRPYLELASSRRSSVISQQTEWDNFRATPDRRAQIHGT